MQKIIAKGFFITGTDTGIGKTVITAGLADCLKQRGINAGVMKPVQSGAIRKGPVLVSADALLAVKTAGVDDPLELVNPYCLEAPLAPKVAAELAGVKINPDRITDAYHQLRSRHELMLVEGAGGIMVPLAKGLLVADLILMLGLPAIIVARPALGTVNHTLLTVEYARARGIRTAGVIINNLIKETEEIAEKTAPALIAEFSGLPVLGIVPHAEGVDVEACEPGEIIEQVNRSINWDLLLANLSF